MKILKGQVTVQNKRYEYTIKETGARTVFLNCKAANIAQEFLKEDIADLLIDLPGLIISEKKYATGRSDTIRFRLSPSDKSRIEQKAIKEGYSSVSEYVRSLALR